MDTESDEHLVRYVLGELPDAEAERLDERSIADGAVAARLRHLENELVDQYSRGDLPGSLRERVERASRVSSHLREKLWFAEALRAVTLSTTAAPSMPIARRSGPTVVRGLAAAAVLLLCAAGYLGLQNLRLHQQLSELEGQQVRVERQNADLQREIEQARSTPLQRQTLTATVLLRPPRRGPDDTTTVVSMAPGITDVTLRLVVETDEYRAFWAAMKDSATSDARWRSPDLTARTEGNDRVVTVSVPAAVFEPRRYLVELSGIAPDGQVELIAQYPVRVVLE